MAITSPFFLPLDILVLVTSDRRASPSVVCLLIW